MSKYNGMTPGPWGWKKFTSNEAELLKLEELGIEPVPMLSNEGQRFIMSGSKRIAMVDCQAPVKRGQGHRSTCDERDANAQAIADAPTLLGQRDRLLSLIKLIAPEMRGLALVSPDAKSLAKMIDTLIADIEATK